jgi:hypothetical protein
VNRRTQNIQIISTNKEEPSLFLIYLFLKNRSPCFNQNFLIPDEDKLVEQKREKGGGFRLQEYNCSDLLIQNRKTDYTNLKKTTKQTGQLK